jgi:hypothetical protein
LEQEILKLFIPHTKQIIDANLLSVRRKASSGMLRHVALVRNDVSEEISTSIIRVTRIGELGTRSRMV